MPKIKIRPSDMAKIHRTKPPGEDGPCQMNYCWCRNFRKTRDSKMTVPIAIMVAVTMRKGDLHKKTVEPPVQPK